VKSEEKILAGLSHLGIIFGSVGILIALAVFFWQNGKSRFAANQAKQALGYQVVVRIIAFVGNGLFWGSAAGLDAALGFFFGGFWLWNLFLLLFNLYGLYAALQALKGYAFRYPLIGDFIDNI